MGEGGGAPGKLVSAPTHDSILPRRDKGEEGGDDERNEVRVLLLVSYYCC